MNYSINPASGYFTDLDWSKKDSVSLELQRQKFAIPESLSNDYVDTSGYQQQTFLGASIRSFNTNAGYGDSSSTLSVELVNDEYNASDRTGLGLGHDVYHNGKYDTFAPPIAGAPVFFQFGKKRASVNEAYQKILDDIYGYNNALSSQASRDAQFHFTFGGILQSYVQNRGPGGNPLYSAQVVDPREILANTTLILNNYAGTTFNNKNMFNLYGFLEYNPTLELKEALDNYFPVKDVLRKNVLPNGSYTYTGLDLYAESPALLLNEYFTAKDYTYQMDPLGYPVLFPITGTGYSRRCSQGMPYYRIKQALEALFGLNGPIPQEYSAAGFGGYINFRGFNYLVDLSGLKKVDNYYFFDFDQINLLDFCLEMCDITSSDLFVSLMPIIDHPAYARFFNWNQTQTGPFGDPTKIIAGVIRVDAINRSFQPQYGAIKNYIDNLSKNGIYVENQDVGFELSNVTTDKFISGAQEVDMYFFSANSDRDLLEERKRKNGIGNALDYYVKNQWNLETSLSQQILPYYGMLGNNAVSITKGFGAYQQILLDSTGLNAAGVKNYYVATEMELRAALVSFERWSQFIASYDSVYMESLEDDDIVEGAALQQSPAPEGAPPVRISNNYGVTVPRSVFPTDDNSYGPDELPNNACNPPYGYPLYYKRATRLGVQAMGLTNLQGKYVGIITSGSELIGAAGDNEKFAKVLQNEWNKYKNMNVSRLNAAERRYVSILQQAINGEITKAATIGLIQGLQKSMTETIKHIGRMSKKVQSNAMKVYNFVKKVADECLGKKFLVKIPREVNLFYNKQITLKNNNVNLAEYEYGPFGFRPRSINYNPYYETSRDFNNLIESERRKALDSQTGKPRVNTIDSFLTRQLPNPAVFQGALNVNFNPLIDKHEFNYAPTKQGGFVNFDFAQNLLNSKLNPGISQGLVPQDMGKFLDENNRISAYVRFDHSESLDFSSVSSDDFSQQSIVAGAFVPDVSESLDNNEPSQFNAFPNADGFDNMKETLNASGMKVGPAIAFMKCDVDEKLYMPPKTAVRPVELHGIALEDIGEYSQPSKIWVEGVCKEFSSFTFYRSNFIPVAPPLSPSLAKLDFVRESNGLISTKTENLDTEHVYALITLPSRAVSTIDARFRDGPFQLSHTERFKHYMCMDVVRLPEFSKPAFRGSATNLVGGRKLSFTASAIGSAVEAYAAAMRSVDAVLPNQMNIMFPSPVYPDLVALPLMSKERCYGPWVSSQIDRQAKVYDNVAGKVEFIKDENLAPWNFNGYDLMNAAGELQARFSNSLLLHSERGGFVIPTAPSGVYLGKFLANAGPLVTNINVDVSEAGIKTTYKMDLYTSSFGKLQKQKQDMISNISRERQKLKDEKNALIRKGLGKFQTNINYNLMYKAMDRDTTSRAQVETYRGSSYPMPSTLTAISSTPQTNKVHATDSTMAAGTEKDRTHHQVNGSIQPEQNAATAMAFHADGASAQVADYNTAGSTVTEQQAGFTHEQGHPNFAGIPQVPPPNSQFVPQYILDSDEWDDPPDHSIFD